MLFREKLLKDIEFIVEMDKLKTIKRKTKLIGLDEEEDDAGAFMAHIIDGYDSC